MFDGPQTASGIARAEGELAAVVERAHQRIGFRHDVRRPALHRLDARGPRDRPALRASAVAAAASKPRRQSHVEAAAGAVGHHAETLAAFDLGHRDLRAERERAGRLIRQRRRLDRGDQAREPADRIDRRAVGGAGMAGAAGDLQAHAMKAAAAADQLVVAGIAQHRGVGLALDRREVGAHAAEAAGMLVGVEQQIDATATDRALAHQIAAAHAPGSPAPVLESAAPRPHRRPPARSPEAAGLDQRVSSPNGAVSMQASRHRIGPGSAPRWRT